MGEVMVGREVFIAVCQDTSISNHGWPISFNSPAFPSMLLHTSLPWKKERETE